MADKIYVGAAVDTAEVGKINVGGTIAIGNTFTVTLGKASVTFTTTTTVVADAVAGILALLNATTARNEFQAITWTSGTGYVQGTGPSDGYPWIDGLSVAKAQGAGGTNTHTISITTVTAGTGSLTWSNTENWAGGVIPVAGDTIHLNLYGIVPKYKIDRNGLASLCTVIVYSGDTSNLFIGLPEVNSGGYPEYLNRYLKIRASLTYGIGTGTFVPKLNMQLEHISLQDSTHTIYRSESRDNSGKAPLQLIGNSSGTYLVNLNINGGNVDLSLEEGETVYSGILNEVYCAGDLRVYGKWTCNPGTMTVKGYVFWGSVGAASLTLYPMPKTLKVLTGGIFRTGRNGDETFVDPEVNLLTIEPGATVNWNRTKTFRQVMTIDNSGTLSFQEDLRGSKKFVLANLYADSQILDPNSSAEFGAINLVQCGIEGNKSVKLDIGNNKSLVFSDSLASRKFSLTYRTANSSTSEGEISSDISDPCSFAIYTTDEELLDVLGSLTLDAVAPGESGSLIELTDGATTLVCRVKDYAPYGVTNVYSIDTWFNPDSAEAFADSTAITFRKLT